MKEITMSELKEQAPSIFTSKPAAGLSEKYTHIPTDRVIKDMIRLGWKPFKAFEIRARKNQGYQKHMVKFYNPNIVIEGKNGDDVYPIILLSNSHNGLSGFKFQSGLFRLVCSNGLVIMDVDMGSFSMRHMGYTFEQLQESINGTVSQFPDLVKKINKFQKVKLNEAQIEEFARKAFEIRFEQDSNILTEESIKEMLEVNRPQDEGSSLWAVMNRIQEKIIHGNFSYFNGKKVRKARRIKSFQQDVKVNAELWAAAEVYA